ncbi:MAG TPA: DUF3393 domain-containing protein [Candidatus Latescibacteria bacterium]|nr:DUF3393 domain-containing protein [Candidatus Latescibacterota bacterium]
MLLNLLLVGLTVSTAFAQRDEAFEEYLRQQEEAYEAYKEEVTKQYQEFLKAEREAFKKFQEEVERKWLKFIGSTEKDWVEYRHNLNVRTKVDFEKGEAWVEVLVNSDPQEEVARLKQAVAELVNDRGTTSDYEVRMPDGTVDVPKPLSDEPVLSRQLRTSDGKPVTEENAEVFASEVVREPYIKREEVVGKDGKRRTKLSVRFPLVPDHLRVRAQKYADLVHQYASKFQLSPPLVFAVIHTESHFNPKARSPVPAYGLMQLVPTSGGRTAYRYIYKEDKVLPPSYFFVPRNNIELGCGYLHYLRTRIFRGIQDDRKAIYCAVAAYNTGPGNVARAFAGKGSLKKALPLVNRMAADEVYDRLRRKLPYRETRKYVEKVFNRMPLYRDS